MKFAEAGGMRVEAKPSAHGFCPACKSRVIPKCGNFRVHHWAHSARPHCDSWWEPETEWHREWKGVFPQEWQEVIHTDESTGERHIADVKTSTGMVFEFQNSSISDLEVRARERFYRKMIWIVNAAPFREDFSLKLGIPDPNSEFGQRFLRGVGLSPGGMGYRGIFPNEDCWSGDELAREIERNFRDHYTYKWRYQRGRWLKAAADVFLDFGGNSLWWLREYPPLELRCVKRISKSDLISKNGGRLPNSWPSGTDLNLPLKLSETWRNIIPGATLNDS